MNNYQAKQAEKFIIKNRTVCVVIICITILELVALNLGYNGTLLKIVLIILAGLGGLVIPTPRSLKGG